MECRRQRDVDGGWAWVVAFGVFLSFLLLGGFSRSFGILYAEFLEMFGESASATSLIPAVRMACPILVGPLSTTLSERFTERKVVIAGSLLIALGMTVSFFASSLDFLIVSLGLLPGVGMALLISPSNVAMGKYFWKWRSRVYSLTSCGVCLGLITVPLFLTYLLDKFTAKGALLIFGGICLNLVITGAVQRPLKVENETEMVVAATDMVQNTNVSPNDAERVRHTQTHPTHSEESDMYQIPQNGDAKSFDKAGEDIGVKVGDNAVSERNATVGIRQTCQQLFRDLFDMTLMKNYVFLIFLVSGSLSDITYSNQSIYLVPLVESRNISRKGAALLLSIMGGCDVIGRLAAGYLADRRPILPHHVMCVCGVVAGISCCFFSLPQTFGEFVAVSLIYALVNSAPTLLIMPALAQTLGVAALARGLGLGMFFRGLVVAVSLPLLGLLKDYSGSYDSIFPVIGCVQIGGAVVLLLIPLARRHMEARTETATTRLR